VVVGVLGLDLQSASATTRFEAGPSRLLAPDVRHSIWHAARSTAELHVVQAGVASRVAVRVVQAEGGLAEGRETTSSLCRRTRGCLAAVNGDFFTGDGPVGGVIVTNRMLRSPVAGHEQLSVDPLRATGAGLGVGGWSGAARVAGRAPIKVDGVNVTLLPGTVVLYTHDYATSTPACDCTELMLAGPAVAATHLSASQAFTPVARGAGASALSEQQVVLAGQGGGAERLQELWAQQAAVTLELRVSAPSSSNIGAHPILLRHGQATAYDEQDPMLSRPQPRTAVAWDDKGQVWLVTVDGRQPGGPGLTAGETVDFLRQLGARHAVLEDGGGSTTLVVGGRVMNRPSDGHERAVSNAVLLIADVPSAAVRRAPVPQATKVAGASGRLTVVPKPARTAVGKPAISPATARPATAPQARIARVLPQPVKKAVPKQPTRPVAAATGGGLALSVVTDPVPARAPKPPVGLALAVALTSAGAWLAAAQSGFTGRRRSGRAAS